MQQPSQGRPRFGNTRRLALGWPRDPGKRRIGMSGLIRVAAGVVAVVALNPPPAGAAQPDFAGRYLAAVSDGDMVARTYFDGRLPAQVLPDKLAIVRDPLHADGPTAEVEVGNSVVGAPYAFDLSPDGHWGYVVEAYGAAPPGAVLRSELPASSRLTVVDLSRREPRVARHVDLGVARPETISVSPGGHALAISTATPGAEVLLVPVRGARVGAPVTASLSALGIAPDPSRRGDGMVASHVEWHPSGRSLALNLDTRDQVQFALVGADLRLAPWGAPVTVGPDPFSGRFAPDGRHFFTSDWGRDFRPEADTLEELMPTRPGTVSVIRLARSGAHAVVDREMSGLSPEGIAISPRGDLLATINMRDSGFPAGHPRFNPESSISLLRFDARTGQLRRVDEQPFRGVLPEHATFDANGRYLAVTVFEYLPPTPGGGIELWRVTGDERLQLERARDRIPVGRGVHHVEVG